MTNDGDPGHHYPVIVYRPGNFEEKILTVKLVDGQFVWRYRGRLLRNDLQRRSAIDETICELLEHETGRFTSIAILQALEAIHSWCERHGVGLDDE